MEGSSRCTLCKNLEEMLEHLFLDSPFANEVWCIVLKELEFNLTLPTNWKEFFNYWKDYYHGSLNKKPYFLRAWVALPKFICWKIWIARNKGIFENVTLSPTKVSSSAKYLWTEALLSKGVRHLHLEPLTPKERIWICDLLGPLKPTPGVIYVKKPNSLR